MNRDQSGFTLIEIAIVLVIIGLLLGGVLKGQELITGARVRNLIQQQDGVKAAYFGFLDRYRALPGDYSSATTNITGTTKNGDGDGQIELDNGTNAESVLAWEHLAKSGFINGSYIYAATSTDASNPKNPYAGFMQLVYDANYGGNTTTTPSPTRHNLKTGPNIPVEIVAELDRKVDDGAPYTGAFQWSPYVPNGGTALTAANCVTVVAATPTTSTWNLKDSNANCGGASLY
jgi:prepilin-type N-terminal cleavage/methylation domain-containing protein